MGNWLRGDMEVAEHIRKWLMDLFSSSQVSAPFREWYPPFWHCEISEDDARSLEALVLDREIYEAFKYLKPYKALDLDGLHAEFFQRFWLIVGDLVKEEVKQIFSTAKILGYLNETLITLIPKCKCPESLNNF